MSRARVVVFGALVGTFVCGYGVLFTVLDEYRGLYGIPVRWLSAVISISFIASFVAQLFVAPIADRGFAKHLIALGAVLNVVGLLVLGFGESLPMLLLGRLLSGLGTGIAMPAVRRIVVNADADNVGANLGLLFSAEVAGFAVGPAISAVMVPWLGLASPFVTIAVFNAAMTVGVFMFGLLPRTQRAVTEHRFAFDLLREGPVLGAMALAAAVAAMIGTFDALWAIVLDDLRAADWIANLGVVLFAVPLVIFGSYGGQLAQRIGPFRLGALGALIGAVATFLYGIAPTAGVMLAVAVVHSVFDGLTIPSSGVAIGLVVPAERQAGAQGLLGAAATLTSAVLALFAGWSYDIGGRILAYTTCAVLMVFMAVAAYLLAGPRYRARPSHEPGGLVAGL